jgi:hypothetical protein
MKKLVITDVTKENYMSVMKRIEKLFPAIRWCRGDEEKPHAIFYSKLMKTSKYNPKNYDVLEIDFNTDELAYIEAKHNPYRFNSKEEVPMSSSDFLTSDPRLIPMGQFINLT